jgi:hypothetical protein
MKKSILVAALLAMGSVSAFATPPAPTNGYSGSVTGTGNITTTGSAIAGSYVSGTGSSIEHSDVNSYGYSTIGGSVTPTGSTVATSTYASTTTHAFGDNDGAGAAQGISGNTIFNGAISFGSTSVGATGTSAFTTSGVSPVHAVDPD